jgi:N-acetylglucosaminyldiphosphoundecaprenol N-acetyl-beta-D-mannosaminyltransferase
MHESVAAAERINASGAGLAFIGLGCPKQDHFAHLHRNRIKAVQLCVGAAFDFHAGTKPSAPGWMQRSGLEWVFRLSTEPGRLWRRYMVTNSIFVFLFARRLLAGR